MKFPNPSLEEIWAAANDEVRQELTLDRAIYGVWYAKVRDDGTVERIDPTTVYKDPLVTEPAIEVVADPDMPPGQANLGYPGKQGVRIVNIGEESEKES